MHCMQTQKHKNRNLVGALHSMLAYLRQFIVKMLGLWFVCNDTKFVWSLILLVWGQNPERKVTLNILGTSWQPVSIWRKLSFYSYFYLFLYLYITRITINKNTPQLKSPKNQSRRADLGRPAMKLLGGGGGGGGGLGKWGRVGGGGVGGFELVWGRPNLALGSCIIFET